ncbi:tRNA methyltransferase 10-like protein B [Armadillidium nasatum]|uniref:RNA (guanine-9-)-methyltransferase domain-containing protein 1 n=1 Tax=Armadillidium nasatum TaxID=96803 RepID=A0A5N5SY18_9CRUS|nr:tRNA methyltransferase 10-like protein B [Armadillidium nasatum]
MKQDYCYCRKASSNSLLNDTNGKDMKDMDKENLKKWITMLKHLGENVPNEISEANLSKLFNIQSQHGRKKFLSFLYGKENLKAIKTVEKEQKIKLSEERKNKPKGNIEYGLWKNSMFIKTTKQLTTSLLNNKLITAIKFNQPLIIDLAFYDHMNEKQATILARQLANCIIQNRLSPEPYNLTLCGVNFDCKKFQIFSQKIMPNILKSEFPINITSKSYLDLYPKEKLIYLTPYTRNEMRSFDHSAVYILGGIVDHGKEHPLTLAKAKRENIKTVKLPLNKCQNFKGRHALNINLVLKILLDLQKDGRQATSLSDYFRMINSLLTKHKMLD